MQTQIKAHTPHFGSSATPTKAALLVAATAALLSIQTAEAQRPNTQAMSCAQARGLVASTGSIVMSTGATTFDKYVLGPGYCSFGEYAYNATVPTQDTHNCPIGYRCDSNPPLYDNLRPRGPAWR